MTLARVIGLTLSVVLVTATSVGCKEADDEDFDSAADEIVGGDEAQPGAWPGTVALYIDNTQACGGTLIADEWVLTAAHCLVSPESATGGLSQVVIGRHRLSSGDGETRTVKKAIRHAGYDATTNDNDIALLQLSSKTNAPRAKLVTKSQITNVSEGATVTVVGWGNTRPFLGRPSDVLRQVSLPLMSIPECRSYRGYDVVTNNQLCAGLPQGGRDSCQGDSGGPLFMTAGTDKVQVGIVSWGRGCARRKAPGVYTNVGNYLDWLSQQSGGAIGKAP